jgi:hypothetical protein
MAPRFTVRPEHTPCAALPLPSSLMAIREYWFSLRRLKKQNFMLRYIFVITFVVCSVEF